MAARNTYDKADVVRLSLTVTDLNNAAVDPGALVLKYKKPDQTTVTLTYGVDVALVRDSAGHYHADVTLDQVGVWTYRFEATGANAGADEHELAVRASAF